MIKKLSPLLLLGGNNLIKILDDISECRSRFEVIRQLYLCYEQCNKHSAISNTVQHILKENFGDDHNLNEHNATIYALFNWLQQVCDEQQ